MITFIVGFVVGYLLGRLKIVEGAVLWLINRIQKRK